MKHSAICHTFTDDVLITGKPFIIANLSFLYSHLPLLKKETKEMNFEWPLMLLVFWKCDVTDSLQKNVTSIVNIISSIHIVISPHPFLPCCCCCWPPQSMNSKLYTWGKGEKKSIGYVGDRWEILLIIKLLLWLKTPLLGNNVSLRTSKSNDTMKTTRWEEMTKHDKHQQ